MHLETYNASLPGSGKYLYAYLRSMRGYGHECNMLLFPYTSKDSIRISLSFIAYIKQTSEPWLSKDLLILAYKREAYVPQVRQFLHDYYEAVPSQVRGRCGYIRTAINLEADSPNFSKASLITESLNSH